MKTEFSCSFVDGGGLPTVGAFGL